MQRHPLSDAPIGIFDSGIGGLSVARAIKHKLPNEQLMYFGDTAHLPYGEKSAAAIQHFVTEISRFLMNKGCKALVVACNSASSVLHELNEWHFDQEMVLNVIDPAASRVAEDPNTRKIGVIGTKKTVLSGIYEERIHKINPQKEVIALPTPLLAPMIEEGFFNDSISATIIHSYLSYPDFSDIDTLILGCTHYPLIRSQIDSFFQHKVSLIDSGEILPNLLKDRLMERGLLHEGPQRAPDHFFVSDYTRSFEQAARLFFGAEVRLEKADIWND